MKDEYRALRKAYRDLTDLMHPFSPSSNTAQNSHDLRKRIDEVFKYVRTSPRVREPLTGMIYDKYQAVFEIIFDGLACELATWDYTFKDIGGVIVTATRAYNSASECTESGKVNPQRKAIYDILKSTKPTTKYTSRAITSSNRRRLSRKKRKELRAAVKNYRDIKSTIRAFEKVKDNILLPWVG